MTVLISDSSRFQLIITIKNIDVVIQIQLIINNNVYLIFLHYFDKMVFIYNVTIPWCLQSVENEDTVEYEEITQTAYKKKMIK